MWFHVILVVLVVGAGIQIARMSVRSTEHVGEAILLWLLVGYCGIPMIGFMAFGLMHPHELAEMTGFEAGSPFQVFMTWALLGMAVAATLSYRFRGSYLVGPALAWAVFFLGATGIHVRQFDVAGELSHASLLLILATHGLISVLLLVGLWMSGVWRTPTDAGGEAPT